MRTKEMEVGKKYVVSTGRRRAAVAEMMQLGLRGPGCTKRSYCKVKILHTTSSSMRGLTPQYPVRNILHEFDPERDGYLLEVEVRQIELSEARRILSESSREMLDRLGFDAYTSVHPYRGSVELRIAFFDLDTAKEFVETMNKIQTPV